MPSIADRLAALRRQRFVGRQAELNLFQDHINGPEFPVAVWHIVGPGGIGKTTLLLQLAQVARTAGLSTCLIDGRNIPATPAGFLEALRQQFAGAADPLQFLRSHNERIVLFIDTFEQLRPLDGWLREQFLPECPATMLTVVAGRQPPTLPWRTDTGWQALLHQVNLRNFSPAESAHYLTQNSLPDGRIKAIQAMTHGFPLALSLVVAQHQLEPE
ncbi:MAG: ATP-binding protein, partial [Anaerolineales bacterium]|nr:ATP-binding protein [Anaerolineales bacterium]